MKPTSVIFLIVSVLLACVGVLLCITASSMATEQGIGLFSQVGGEGDNYIATQTFSEEELKKIVIKVSDVKVNVIGGSDESKIELVNFMNNSYQIQAGRATLQISDNAGISGLIDLENFKINFGGFRDYLHYFSDFIAGKEQKERIVNIYLTDAADLVNFNIIAGNSDITISDMTTDCDYKIVLESGVVDIDNVVTESSIQIESTKSSSIEINNVKTEELHIIASESECFAEIADMTFSRAMYVEVKSGDIVYDRVEDDFAGLDVKLLAEGNTISVYGQSYASSYEEQNAPTEPVTPPETTPPEEDPDAVTTADPDETSPDPDATVSPDESTAPEQTTGPEDIGDLDDETPDTSLTVPANSLTIVIADGHIEIK